MADVWFADSEVFRYDSLWVFEQKRTGRIEWFHNDHEGVKEFIESNPDMWLCGYNFQGYDQYILKGTMLGYDNSQLKALNDYLIHGTLQDAWDYLGSDAWDVDVPPIIDLFHDIVPRKSLKEIEGNIGLNVVETSVDFDIDRPLTEDEFKRTLFYCKYDVSATKNLYYKRLAYLKAKKDLCGLAGLDDSEMMRYTNARVTAEALHAESINPLVTFGVERYEPVAPWDIVDKSKLPKEVLDFIPIVDALTGTEGHEFDTTPFYLWGTPTIMARGGIHAATGYIEKHVFKSGNRKGQYEMIAHSVPSYFESDDEHVVLIQDIGSFYPSMMLLFDYLSRAIPEADKYIFQDFYDTRMEAKRKSAECDKLKDMKGKAYWSAIAEAAKLVLNTTYGVMGNQYNKLYDPFKSVCVCLSGQLFIIDLMNRIHDAIPDFEIIQLNTDGWVLRIRRDRQSVLSNIIASWCKTTGFTVDTDIVSRLWQRDVNNYVMEFDTGKVKAKGGVVKNWKGGDFKSNSATIVDTAIVKYLIDDVPIEDTVSQCDDMLQLQLILKAGSTFDCTAKMNGGEKHYLDGRVHRIYPVKKDGYRFVKLKGNSVSKFPDTPSCADEDLFVKSIDQIDKNWYIVSAKEKLAKFLGEDEE